MKLLFIAVKDFWHVFLGLIALVSILNELTFGQKALAARVDKIESIAPDIVTIKNDVKWLIEIQRDK